MLKIPIKSTKYFSLPALGIGMWGMGGMQTRDPNNDDERDALAIKEAIKRGITHIDTAERYAEGIAERILGKAIENFPRKNLFITSKVSPEHLSYDDVIRSAQDTLQRIGISYLDLYLIHASNPIIPLRETMKAFGYLFENGIIKNIGVSNFNISLIQEAQGYSKYKIVNNQIHYSLTARAYKENRTLDYCSKNNILVTAYRPLGKYGDLAYSHEDTLLNLSKKYNRTQAQIAINWILNKPNIVVLVKTSNIKHLDEDLGCLSWKLKKEDEKLLDEEFPREETINLP